MLLALLIYAYGWGQRSSRQFEQLLGIDVGGPAGDADPAHDQDENRIARFRGFSTARPEDFG